MPPAIVMLCWSAEPVAAWFNVIVAPVKVIGAVVAAATSGTALKLTVIVVKVIVSPTVLPVAA